MNLYAIREYTGRLWNGKVEPVKLVTKCEGEIPAFTKQLIYLK